MTGCFACRSHRLIPKRICADGRTELPHVSLACTRITARSPAVAWFNASPLTELVLAQSSFGSMTSRSGAGGTPPRPSPMTTSPPMMTAPAS